MSMKHTTTNLLKTSFLLLVCKKGQKEDKSKFVTKSVGIIVTIISCKNISQIAGKTFATHCFFTDRLNRKIVNKTCRTPSANPHQLWTN